MYNRILTLASQLEEFTKIEKKTFLAPLFSLLEIQLQKFLDDGKPISAISDCNRTYLTAITMTAGKSVTKLYL